VLRLSTGSRLSQYSSSNSGTNGAGLLAEHHYSSTALQQPQQQDQRQQWLASGSTARRCFSKVPGHVGAAARGIFRATSAAAAAATAAPKTTNSRQYRGPAQGEQ